MKTSSPLITLREISAETVGAIVKLEVAEDQKNFVASNAVSLAQALFSPEAWYRAIYCGDEPVGFVMLYDEALRPATPPHPKVGVWRLMVDRRFQGLQVIEHVRAKGLYSKLELSYLPGPGSPEPFYRQLGFQPNGKVENGEVVLEFPLAGSSA
jgi:diamine N-acetyltransferase